MGDLGLTIGLLAFFINIQRPVLGFNTFPAGHFLGDVGLTIGLLAFFINIQRPVLGFNTFPTGHFLGDLGLTIGLLAFFINIQRPVLGFNTFPAGHFLGDLVGDFTGEFTAFISLSLEVSCLASLRTYINSLPPLLKLKQRSLTFNFFLNNSGIHFAVFKQKSLFLMIFQLYFISSQGISLVIFLAITGSILVRVQPL